MGWLGYMRNYDTFAMETELNHQPLGLVIPYFDVAIACANAKKPGMDG